MAKEKNEKSSSIHEGDLGSLLREYREIAGYSLSEMAEALCLSDDVLVKLENEDFQDLAEPPYVRGYLRNYAKLAEKDALELINRYESLRGAEPSDLDYHFKAKPTILSDSKRKVSPVMGQLLLLSLLLSLLVGISMIPAVNKWIKNTWESFSEQTQNNSTIVNQDLIGTMPIPEPLQIENQANKSEKNSTTLNNQTSEIVDETKNKALKNTQQQTTAQQPDNMATTEQVTATTEANQDTTSTSDTINIKLIFNKEVWMRIKDSENKILFEGLNPAGGSKDLNLKKPLHFKVGNAQGLSLFVDDKAVDISSYIKGSVAKFTLE